MCLLDIIKSQNKVNVKNNYAFLSYVGDSNCSSHDNALKACEDLIYTHQ